MAKHITNKAEKRWKEERKHRRQQKTFDILKGVNGRNLVTLFTPEEKQRHFARLTAIGWARCPLCENSRVLVTNNQGVDGSSEFDCLVNHNQKKVASLCEGSKKRLRDLL